MLRRLIFALLLQHCFLSVSEAQAAPGLRCGQKAGEEPLRDALALSGGGYRAMLFHIGALIRLNEIGCLRRLSAISAVSGGSIVAGHLANSWHKLIFNEEDVATNFRSVVVDPLIEFSEHTIIDVSVKSYFEVLKSITKSGSPNHILEAAYDKYLFHNARLESLPDQPQFIFNAVNVQTGEVWTFRKQFAGDNVAGSFASGKLSLASAVAASSAYPPILAPHTLELGTVTWKDAPTLPGRAKLKPAALAEYRKRPLLADGGLVDNLGLEPIWDEDYAVLVSDGGSVFAPDPNSLNGITKSLSTYIDLMYAQHSKLRTRILKDIFKTHKPTRGVTGSRFGTIWNIHGAACHYDVALGTVPDSVIADLAKTPTTLSSIPKDRARQLVNWGYLSADRSFPYLTRFWSSSNEYSVPPASQPFDGSALPLTPYSPCSN